MTVHAHTDLDPDLTDLDDGLRGGLDFIAMAEAALAHGGPAARRGAVRALGWIDGTEPDPTVALCMTGSGRRHPRQVLRQMRRGAALRRLWRRFYRDLGPTAAADLIVSRWRHYAASAWLRDRDAGTTPTDALDAALHWLLTSGHDPLSAETLRKLLGENGRFAPVEMTGRNDDL